MQMYGAGGRVSREHYRAKQTLVWGPFSALAGLPVRFRVEDSDKSLVSVGIVWRHMNPIGYDAER